MAEKQTSGDAMIPLRVLCIHGYRQNAQTFRERTGAFRKITKKHAELVFISAPNQVPADTEASAHDPEEDDGQRGWWFSEPNDKFNAHDSTNCCKGYEESLKIIKEAIEKDGPFDGVLGFSQGASMVSLLCGLQEQKIDPALRFNFAILVAGFKSRSSEHDVLYSKQVALPTLHVFGDTDRVIEKDMSENLLQHYHDPVVLNHPGGHFIPASGPQKKVYLEFFKHMIELRKGAS